MSYYTNRVKKLSAISIQHHELSCPGARAIAAGMNNQDRIDYYTNNVVEAIIMSDGCTGCESPERACEINHYVITSFIEKHKEELFSFREKKLRDMLCDEFREAFDEEPEETSQLSATIAVIIINKMTRQFIVFALGDAAILTYNKKMHLQSFFDPQNALFGIKNMTYFTNNDSAMQKLSFIQKGYLDDNKCGFLMYTDGAAILDNEKESSLLLKAFYTSPEAYESRLDTVVNKITKKYHDDYSIAFIGEKFAVEGLTVALPNDDDETMEEAQAAVQDFTAATAVYEKPLTEESIAKPVNVPIHQEQPAQVMVTSPLLCFLAEPRSIEAIVRSGLLNAEEITPTLYTLVSIGAVIADSENQTFQVR